MESQKEWVCLTEAAKILGIPRQEILSCIHNMRIPFHKNGRNYSLNIKLVRAYFCRMDIENMNEGRKMLNAMPFNRRKVTGKVYPMSRTNF